jgi:hypothetical protein
MTHDDDLSRPCITAFDAEGRERDSWTVDEFVHNSAIARRKDIGALPKLEEISETKSWQTSTTAVKRWHEVRVTDPLAHRAQLKRLLGL